MLLIVNQVFGHAERLVKILTIILLSWLAPYIASASMNWGISLFTVVKLSLTWSVPSRKWVSKTSPWPGSFLRPFLKGFYHFCSHSVLTTRNCSPLRMTFLFQNSPAQCNTFPKVSSACTGEHQWSYRKYATMLWCGIDSGAIVISFKNFSKVEAIVGLGGEPAGECDWLDSLEWT